jgi:methylase of polypeptide subunit release factors
MTNPKITREAYLAEYKDVREPYKVKCPVTAIRDEWWVLPGVLDPTKAYLSTMFAEIARKCPHYSGKVLVVGSGCGIDAVLAAQKNKIVHAVDISPRAVVNTQINAEMHGADNMQVYRSDCFSDVKGRAFDFIYFNQPVLFPNHPATGFETPRKSLEWAICDYEFKLMRKFLREAPKYLVREGGGGLGGGVITTTSTVNGGHSRFMKCVKEFGYHEAMVLHRRKLHGEEFYVYGMSPTWRKKSGRRKKSR